MERRFFLKMGALAVLSPFGFTEDIFCFQKKIKGMGSAGMKHIQFTGVYSSTVENNKVSMPGAFYPSLLQHRFMLVVPQGNTSILLALENSPEWELLKHACDATENHVPEVFWERAVIDWDGRLHLSDEVRKSAGIQRPNVSIIGHGYLIEITDSQILASRRP